MNKKEILATLYLIQRDYNQTMLGRMAANLQNLINKISDEITEEANSQ